MARAAVPCRRWYAGIAHHAALLAAAGRPSRAPASSGRKAAEYGDAAGGCQFAARPGGWFHRGSLLEPIRNSSIARAHCRPSRIAQTTSDWPRRMSPAANTFGTEVCVVERIGGDVAARIERDAGLFDEPGTARPNKSHRQQHQIGFELERTVGEFLHRPAAVGALGPLDPHAFERLDMAVRADERALSAPPIRARSPLRARTKSAALAANPARPAPCSRAPAVWAGSRAA